MAEAESQNVGKFMLSALQNIGINLDFEENYYVNGENAFCWIVKNTTVLTFCGVSY